MAKGKIAHSFLLLSLCFLKKPSAAEASESVHLRERVKNMLAHRSKMNPYDLHEYPPFNT